MLHLVQFGHMKCSILTYFEAGLIHDASHGEADVNSVEMERVRTSEK